VSKVLNRSRRSFLEKKFKRTISYGVITPEMEQMYSDSIILESEEELPAVEKSHTLDGTSMAGRPSKDGGDSIGRTSSSVNGDDEAPAAKQVQTPESPKRSGLLRKLRIHH
jgi:hypothetical protein